jgi:hypothetical protein
LLVQPTRRRTWPAPSTRPSSASGPERPSSPCGSARSAPLPGTPT